MWRRGVIACCLAAAVAVSAAAPAVADVDPASDVLLLQDVFTPQSPPAVKERVDELRAVAAASRKAGYPIKVAVIGARSDLGGIPQLFGKPQQYARFLGTELTTAGGDKRKPLLVVMAAGFGTFEVDDKATEALKGVDIGQGGNDDLVEAASQGVRKMASAAGHPVGDVSGGGGGSSAPVWAFVLPVILLAAAGLIYSQRGRRDEADEASDVDSGT